MVWVYLLDASEFYKGESSDSCVVMVEGSDGVGVAEEVGNLIGWEEEINGLKSRIDSFDK